MRNSIATYKETLSRIANDVLDDEEELEISGSLTSAAADDSPIAGRSYSRRSSALTPPIGSPVATGDEPGSANEIAKYKADIQKLQASEAEIKALSFNYASILKEREDQLSKLHKENGSLKKSLEAKSMVEHESRVDGQKFLSNEANFLKVNADRSPVRTLKHTSQSNSRANGNHASKGNATRQDGFSNSGAQAIQLSATPQKMDLKSTNSQEYGEEEKIALEDHQASIVALQATHEFEINELKAQLKNEHENVTLIKLKLQEEQRSNESSQRGLHDLKMDKERISTEMKVLQEKLNEKISELSQLQVELNRRDIDENQSLDSMKKTIRALQTENANLKIEKDELEANLKLHMKCRPENLDAENLDYPNKEVTEEMTLSLRKLEDTLKETCKERDKALQELARLKQHLLDKELEDTEKMDEDNKTIEELTATSEYQRAKILQLEKALRQERANKDGISKSTNDEFQRLNEIIDGLKQNLADCMRKVDSKNVELLNLQTALGQYYAEIEAKERLERDLGRAREESTRLSESLKVANQGMENLRREKEDAVVKLSEAERMLSEGKVSIQKLGEENSKLRRALEQSMMRLNRMSLDSDNYVDRRIVIKLLVTYFQRNHSKEVLDLMVRMLGFSEEDKQRIGFAHHSAGKGVVRGVLGLPGRLVGGILGGSSPDASSHSTSESFADLWVDFLLKETEERERRESSEAATVSSSSAPKNTNTRIPLPPSIPHSTDFPRAAANFAALRSSSADQIPGSQGKQYHFSGNPDSEFATVPLTSPASHSDSTSRPPPRFR